MPATMEQRTVQTEFRATSEGGLVGYAAVFDELSKPIGGQFREKIAPGAFSEAIGRDDVRALLNHDPNYVLGRTKSGTLHLQEDDEGLRVEIDLPKHRSEVREAVERGDIDQMSFGFEVPQGGETWERTEDGEDIRTITDVVLWDVSLVTYPAYEGTSVSVKARCRDGQCVDMTGPVYDFRGAGQPSPALPTDLGEINRQSRDALNQARKHARHSRQLLLEYDMNGGARKDVQRIRAHQAQAQHWLGRRRELKAQRQEIEAERHRQRRRPHERRRTISPRELRRILEDRKRRHDAESIRGTAHHEAGHAVAAVMMGYRPNAARLLFKRRGTGWAPAGGQVAIPGGGATPLIAACGEAATEQVELPNDAPSSWGARDRRRVRERLREGETYGDVMDDARVIVECYQYLIDAVAEELLARGELDGRELVKVMKDAANLEDFQHIKKKERRW